MNFCSNSLSRFNENELSLTKRLKSSCALGNLGNYVRIFTDKKENKLTDHVHKLNDVFYGLQFTSMRQLIY